jgi:hypothetical protein
MKHWIFLAIGLFAAAAAAQPAKEAAKPEPVVKEAPKPEPMQSAAKAEGKMKPLPKHRRWNEDARHCLGLPSNTEVIKCAEEFL